MKIQEWLDQVAYIGDSTIPNDDGKVYYSKFDGSYITRVGMEDEVKFLADLEITEQLTSGVGFSPKDNKWYGWSHRGIRGFTIGSEVKKGDVAYTPANIEEALDNCLAFWDDEDNEWTKASIVAPNHIRVTWKNGNSIPNESMRGTIDHHDYEYGEGYFFGRGEWVAKTMEDAKQMAIDYNENIS